LLKETVSSFGSHGTSGSALLKLYGATNWPLPSSLAGLLDAGIHSSFFCRSRSSSSRLFLSSLSFFIRSFSFSLSRAFCFSRAAGSCELLARAGGAPELLAPGAPPGAPGGGGPGGPGTGIPVIGPGTGIPPPPMPIIGPGAAPPSI